MKPTFFVVGHRGMLGHVVVRFLREEGHDVLTGDERYAGLGDDPLIHTVASSTADVVVNCAGVTTARRVVDERLFVGNTLLPLHLAAALDGRPLIHASTDCVFRGDRGGYGVNERPDANEPYGLSKRLGEACTQEANVVVIRTSIVGPELGTARGLLAWFLAQSQPVDGWVDHRWNGITTLEWARTSLAFAQGRPGLHAGIHQPATEKVVSKYELLQLFASTFNRVVPIRPIETGAPCDRSLRPTMDVPPLVDQLAELRDWSRSTPL